MHHARCLVRCDGVVAGEDENEMSTDEKRMFLQILNSGVRPSEVARRICRGTQQREPLDGGKQRGGRGGEGRDLVGGDASQVAEQVCGVLDDSGHLTQVEQCRPFGQSRKSVGIGEILGGRQEAGMMP